MSLVEALRQRFRVLPADPLEFARRNRVLPVRIGEVRIDLVLADLPYEEAAICRAQVVDVGGRPIRMCSPEDLNHPQDHIGPVAGLGGRAGGYQAAGQGSRPAVHGSDSSRVQPCA